MIDFILCNWIFLSGGALLGFAVGVLTGFFGAGGGFIVTPALNILLGMEMNYAVGTSACQVLGTSAWALKHHMDRRLMGIRVAIFTGIGVPFGTFTGAYAVQILKGKAAWHICGKTIEPVNFVLLTVFAFFLIIIAAWLLYDNFFRVKDSNDDESAHTGLLFQLKISPMGRFRSIPAGEFSIPVMIILGVAVGFLSGMLGIGGGVVLLPVLFYLVGQETKYAALTTTMLIFVSSGFATIFHAWNHNINYTMTAVLISGAFGGTRLGALLQKKVSGQAIRKYFGFVVMAAWLLVVYKLIKILT